MEETFQKNSGPGPYLLHILNLPINRDKGKKRLTEAIAKAWEIPEEKVLGNTEVINKKHLSLKSARGERIQIPGERKIDYVNARKFYFYVMIEINPHSWKELTIITGRKIAAMKYANAKAKIHMEKEKDYMMKAQYVLNLINRNQIIFPTPTIIFETKVTVFNRKLTQM